MDQVQVEGHREPGRGVHHRPCVGVCEAERELEQVAWPISHVLMGACK
jgi:hypothetical protein